MTETNPTSGNPTARFEPASPNGPKKRLSREQIEAYNARGYLVGLPVFTSEEADANRAGFDRLLATFQARGFDSYAITGFHSKCVSIYDIATHPTILDYVEDVLGPNFVLWGSNYFCKLPGDPKQIAWHQDAPYWPLAPSRTVTVWLAIDDVDSENSALRVIPGTHTRGALPTRTSTFEENNVLYLTLEGADKLGDPVTLALKAGTVSMHSDLLVHGSEPNRSSRRRCGVALRYASTDVRMQIPNWVPNAILCRGVDAENHWPVCSRPKSDDPFAPSRALADEGPSASPEEIQARVAAVLATLMKPDQTKHVSGWTDATYKMLLHGPGGGAYRFHLSDAPKMFDTVEGDAHITMEFDAKDFVAMLDGRVSAEELYFDGRMKLHGVVGLGSQLGALLAASSGGA